MTHRLNEAQRVLLDPDLRARADRLGRHRDETHPAAAPEPVFTERDFRWEPAFRTARPDPIPEKYNPVWDVLAISAITTIVIATIGILTTTYSGPLGAISPRLVPPMIVALTWVAAGLSRPPRIVYFLLGSSMLLWPLAAAGVWPFTFIVSASPTWMWGMLTASFVATIVLRISLPRLTPIQLKRPNPGRASTV